MAVRTKIYPPGAKLNEQSEDYKVSAWVDGLHVGIKFAKTKTQALEKERRMRKQFKNMKLNK